MKLGYKNVKVNGKKYYFKLLNNSIKVYDDKRITIYLYEDHYHIEGGIIVDTKITKDMVKYFITHDKLFYRDDDIVEMLKIINREEKLKRILKLEKK